MECDVMSDEWRKLRIHDPACTNHEIRKYISCTELWRNLIWMMEDTRYPGWEDLASALMNIPVSAQRAFIAQADSAFKKPCWRYKAKLKNFGVPFSVYGGSALLVGQLYENWDVHSLDTNAVETLGLDFGGRHGHCIVISLDLTARNPGNVRRINRSDVWPQEADFGAYIRYHSDDFLPERATT